MSAYSYDNHMSSYQRADSVPDLSIWDADFVDMHLNVTQSTTVRVDERWACNLPGLAHAYLGSQYLWWALLMYNGLTDAVRDVRPGIELRIPDRGSLMTYMANRRSSSTSNANSTLI